MRSIDGWVFTYWQRGGMGGMRVRQEQGGGGWWLGRGAQDEENTILQVEHLTSPQKKSALIECFFDEHFMFIQHSALRASCALNRNSNKFSLKIRSNPSHPCP